MKHITILMILIGLSLVTAFVTAAEETEEMMEVISIDEMSTTNLFSPDAREAFADVIQKILMITEEAFGYLLSGNAGEKQAFLDEFATLEDDYATFRDVIDLNATEYAEMTILFNELNNATDDMETTAQIMFASYEENQAVTLEEAMAFEDAVDTATSAAHQIWILNTESGTEPSNLEAYKDRLMSSLFRAIEESYAYPILGDTIEKEEALDNFARFDELAIEFTEQFPEESCEDLKIVKNDLMTAAEAMFAAYETDGAVSPDIFGTFEAFVEEFNDAYRAIELQEDAEKEVAGEEVA
ncbi:MAG: hypothetical protein JXA44_01420 [Methanospirillaceae archaeon]|nr:hypothetical protein [Methanospirillaceae archaeon]